MWTKGTSNPNRRRRDAKLWKVALQQVYVWFRVFLQFFVWIASQVWSGNATILQLQTKRMGKVRHLCVENLYEVQLPKNKHFKQQCGLELRTDGPPHACPPTVRQKPDLDKSWMEPIPAHSGAVWQKPNW